MQAVPFAAKMRGMLLGRPFLLIANIFAAIILIQAPTFIPTGPIFYVLLAACIPLAFFKSPQHTNKYIDLAQFAVVVTFAQILFAYFSVVISQVAVTTGPTESILYTLNNATIGHFSVYPLVAAIGWSLLVQYFMHHKNILPIPGLIGQYIYPASLHIRAERFTSSTTATCATVLIGLLQMAIVILALRFFEILSETQTMLSPLTIMALCIVSIASKGSVVINKIYQYVQKGYRLGAFMLFTVVFLFGFCVFGETLTQFKGQSIPVPAELYHFDNFLHYFDNILALLSWCFVPLLASIVTRYGKNISPVIQVILCAVPVFFYGMQPESIAQFFIQHANIFSDAPLYILSMTYILLVSILWMDVNTRFYVTGFVPCYSTRLFGLKKIIPTWINLPFFMLFVFSLTGWVSLYLLLGIPVLSLMWCFIVGFAALIQHKLGFYQTKKAVKI